jgi:biopolymer transport protein ExbD
MIDIVFNLLIFFMVATRFQTTEGQLQAFLPKQGSGGCGSMCYVSQVRIKLLWVDAEGRPTRDVDGHVVLKVGDETLNEPGQLDGRDMHREPAWSELQALLLELSKGYTGDPGGMPVIIDAREPVPTRHVVLVLNEVARANLEDVTFAAPEREY